MSRDYVAEAIEYIYKPLVPAFKKVMTADFIKNDFHPNGEILGLSAGRLMVKIPKEWRKRARSDAFKGMRTFRALIKDTARVTGQSIIDAPAGVKHPKNPSLNATNFDDLQTNYEPFLISNYNIWAENAYKDYKESIADPKSKLFIKTPIVRMLIARYVRECVHHVSDSLPDYLEESDCLFDTENDDGTHKEFYGSSQA